VLRGDLALTPLDEVLRLLANDQLTGRLALNDGGKGAVARNAEIYVATGEIYAAWLADADADPALAADERLRLRLIAEGTLRQDAWEDALAAQEELYDWSIGELLVELGHLERAVLEQVAREELLDAVAQASGWALGGYRFRRRERTRNRAGRTYTVSQFLEAVSGRRAERERLQLPATAVPSLGEGAADIVGLEAAVLGLVDGVRSVADIEVGCGCTGLEVAMILRSLADRGHVALPAPPVEVVAEDAEPIVADEEDPISRWSALLDATLPPAAPQDAPHSTVEMVRSDLPARPIENIDPETAERRARLRARAAEELLAAQAEAEALREAAVARAALADELSVVESLAVVETAEAPESIEPTELEPVATAVSGAEAGVEADEVAEVSLVAETTEELVESTEAPAESAETPVASVEVPVESIESIEVPVEVIESVEIPVEPAEVADTSAELPERVVEDAREQHAVPTDEAPIDLPSLPILDLVAEELLAADLPLAEVPSEAISAELTAEPEQAQVADPDPVAELDAVLPEAVHEAPGADDEVEFPEPSHDDNVEAGLEIATDEQVAEVVDEIDDQPIAEAADEHDPALAAALLRELSSLGLDDEPAPALTTTAPRTPRVPAPRHAAPARKKRGIFGR
jgi:hypothetical protein